MIDVKGKKLSQAIFSQNDKLIRYKQRKTTKCPRYIPVQISILNKSSKQLTTEKKD